MKQLKIAITLLLLSSFYLTYGESQNPISIKYILKSPTIEGTYNIYADNLSSSPANNKLYIDSVIAPVTIKQSLKKDNLEINDFLKTNAKIEIEKWDLNSSSGATVDSKTKPIQIRQLNDTYILSNYELQSILGVNMIIIPIKSDINAINFSKKDYKLNINGTDFPLEYDTQKYNEDKYYINKDKIIFSYKKLPNKENIVILKIDGIKSNYIKIDKEKYIFGGINSIEEDGSSILKSIRVHIKNDPNLNSLNKIEAYINGKKISENDITLVGGELILKIDVSKKIDDMLSFYIKDVSDNSYSNTIYINTLKYTVPVISKLDFGSNFGAYNNFDFKMVGKNLYGNLNNVEILLNGTGLTIDGEKDYIKDDKGVILTDARGNQKYNVINQINLQRDSESLSFPYSTTKLQEINILKINNKNNEKSSNSVYFTKDLKEINYDYTSTVPQTVYGEEIIYTKPYEIQKKIDFIMTPETNFKIGKVEFKNLKEKTYYKFSFTLHSNSPLNPFSDVKFGNFYLNVNRDSSGYNYTFEKYGFGKEFATTDITFSLNELFNVGNNVKLQLIDIKLDALNEDSIFTNIYKYSSPNDMLVKYKYNYSNCFDGPLDYCHVLNLGGDSYLDFELSFLSNSSLSQSSISSTQTVNTTENKVGSDIQNNTTKENEKELYEKQLEKAKNNITNQKKYSKFIVPIDNLVNSFSKEKSQKIFNKIKKLDKQKLGEVTDLFNYLEAKLAMKVY